LKFYMEKDGEEAALSRLAQARELKYRLSKMP
jgi:hypothetical protein